MSTNQVERRNEPRFNIKALASMKVSGRRRTLPAKITNVSDHGIGLQAPLWLCVPGEAIRIRVRRQAIWGTLKHWQPMGSEIAAGLELKRALNDEQMKALLAEFVAGL